MRIIILDIFSSLSALNVTCDIGNNLQVRPGLFCIVLAPNLHPLNS